MNRVRFPPRSALPRDVVIEKVPLLGTTWYERGVGYWARRVLMLVLGALIVLVFVAILDGALDQFPGRSTGFWVTLGVEIAYSTVLIVWLTVRTARRWNDSEPPRRRPARRRHGVLGGLVGFCLAVVAAVVVFATVFFLGSYVFLFATMFLPETLWDHPARLRLTKVLRDKNLLPTDQ